MFDPGSAVVGGVEVIVLVFGLVEFFKSLLNLQGKTVTVLAAVMGMVLFVAYRLIGLIPAPYELVVEIVFQSLAFGLAASGFYKFAAARLPQRADG